MEPVKSLGVFEKMINTSLDVFGRMDRAGYIHYISNACKGILGYESSEMLGRHFSDFIHPDDLLVTTEAMQEIFENQSTLVFDNRFIHKEGKTAYMHWSGAWSEDDETLCFVGRDVTEQKLGNQKLREAEELHRALVEHGIDMLALFDEEVNFIYSGGSTQRILGYAPEQLVGLNAFSFIHPEDQPMVQEKLALVLASEDYTIISGFRFKHSNGEWRWMETSLSNQLHNPAVRALVTSSRDISERFTNEQRLLESQQRFKAMFDDNPDMVLIENRDGLILDANRAAEMLLGLPKQDIINKNIGVFLPPTAQSLCTENLKKAFDGNTVKFTLEATYEGSEETVLDITKIPVTIKEEVLAVHTVIKDITAATKYHKAVEEHARKLTNIFESITDAFCTIDRNWKYTYVNSEFERQTKCGKEDYIGRSFFEIYPNSIGGIFHQQYLHALETGNTVHFDAYSEALDLWLNVKAYPSEEGLSIYFSDISDKIKSQRELQKMSLFASHTTNGVIITDAERRIEWVNEGFTRLTGYTLDEIAGIRPSELLLTQETDITPYEAVKEDLLRGEPVSLEIQNKRKNGEIIWTSIQVNNVNDERGDILNFIVILTDITERKKSQQELEKLSLVASRTDNGVVITDANGLTEWVNEGFTNITGYTLAEVAGIKPGALLQGEETQPETVRTMSEKLKQGLHFNTNLINYKKTGEKFWVSMDITPIFDNSGKITQFIAIQKDITLAKDADEKLLKMTQDLYVQNTHLQQFTYIVSHNLRAPVANALGLTHLLERIDKGTELYDKSLAKLKQSVLSLDTVLRDLNTILSVRDSKGSFEREQVDIKLQIQQAQSALQEQIQLCGGTLSIEIGNNVNTYTNRAYLYSIFYNLLSNAIKYRSEKRALQVRVKCFADNKKGTIISFSDNGSGFDMSRAKEDIFKLYKRFHTDRKGRGIGLYLIKTHLEVMGGHIEVSSEVGIGTRFVIYLPKA